MVVPNRSDDVVLGAGRFPKVSNDIGGQDQQLTGHHL